MYIHPKNHPKHSHSSDVGPLKVSLFKGHQPSPRNNDASSNSSSSCCAASISGSWCKPKHCATAEEPYW